MMDPIMDEAVNYTCGPREYISGITRMADTRIQLMCCRLRSRDEKNCVEKKFAKPIVDEGRVEIENEAQLINALAIKGNYYVARFCDLGPRAIGFIVEDVPTTTPKPTTKSWTTKAQRTRATTLPSTRRTTERTTFTSSMPWWFTTTTTRIPMRIIKVAQPAFLRNPQAWDLNLEHQIKSQLPNDQIRFEKQPYTELQPPPTETPTFSQNDINSQNVPSQVENSILTVQVENSMLTEGDEHRRQYVNSFQNPLVTRNPYATLNPQKIASSRERTISQKVASSERFANFQKPLINLIRSQPNVETVFPKQQSAENGFLKQHGVETVVPKQPISLPVDSGNVETSYPDQDYEYEEKTSKELMKSIVDFMEAQKRAKNMVEKVKSSGVNRNNKEQYQLAKQLLKEFEEVSPELMGSLAKSAEKSHEIQQTSTADTPSIDFKSIEQVSVPKFRFSNSQTSSIGTVPFTSTKLETSTSPSSTTTLEPLTTSTQPDTTSSMFKSMEDLITGLTVPTEAPQPSKHGHHSHNPTLSHIHSSSKEHKVKPSTKDKSKRLYLFISSTIPTTITSTQTTTISPEDWFRQMSEVITQTATEVPRTLPETSTVPTSGTTSGRHRPHLVAGFVEDKFLDNEGESNIEEPKSVLYDQETTSSSLPSLESDYENDELQPEISPNDEHQQEVPFINEPHPEIPLNDYQAPKNKEEYSEYEDKEYKEIEESLTTDSSTSNPISATPQDPLYATMSTTQTWSTTDKIDAQEQGQPWDESNIVTFKPIEEELNLEDWKHNGVEIRKSPQRGQQTMNSVSNQAIPASQQMQSSPERSISSNFPSNQQQQYVMSQVNGVQTWVPQNQAQQAQFWPQAPAQQQQPISQGAAQQQLWQGQQQFLGQNQQFVNPNLNQHQSWMLQRFQQQPQQQNFQQVPSFQQQQQQQIWQNPQFNVAQGVAQVQQSPSHPQIQSHQQVQQHAQNPNSRDLYPTSSTQRTAEAEAAAIEASLKQRRTKPTPNPKYPLSNSRGKILNEPYMDEETEESPFDIVQGVHRQGSPANSHRTGPTAIDPEVLGAFSLDESPKEIEITENKPKSPFDVSKEIRRSPIPRHKQIADPIAKIDPSETKFDSISKTPTTEKPNLVEKFDMNMVFPTFDDYQNNPNQEYEVDMPNLKNQNDGVQTYQPHEGEPLQTGAIGEQLVVFDKMDSISTKKDEKEQDSGSQQEKDIEKHVSKSNAEKSRELILSKKRRPIKHVWPKEEVTTMENRIEITIETTSPPMTEEITETTSTEATTNGDLEHPAMARDSVFTQWDARRFRDEPHPKSTSTEAYDVRKFYHTLKPKRPLSKERYLTFCTKEVAIRDENDLVVACGSELEVWQPNRCPPDSDCFIAPDSTYRICCPVYSG
uniref:Uncharacterized protein n=1 Tax=Acrobeloides nanus TaxID=290746 RepID=A0A914DHU0_9BILA